jgi:hypothetical protein
MSGEVKRSVTVTATATALAIVSASAIGCGAADPWVPDDIDEEATLAAVGDEGKTRVCAAFEDYMLDQWRDSYLVEAVCLAQAIMDNTDADACSDDAQACIETPPAEVRNAVDTILAQATCARIDVTAGGCERSVGDLVECLDDLETEIAALRLTAACAAAGQEVDPTWSLIDVPSSCRDLAEDC